MIEIITDFIVPTGGIYAFGLFSIHIVDSVRFIATRLGILNSGQEDLIPEIDETTEGIRRIVEGEQSNHDIDRDDDEMIETMEGGFATMSNILADMGERHELSDSRMLNLHKYNKTMFSRLSSRLDSTERLFEEILGPLEEIIQGIQENSTPSTRTIDLVPGQTDDENIPVGTHVGVIRYD